MVALAVSACPDKSTLSEFNMERGWLEVIGAKTGSGVVGRETHRVMSLPQTAHMPLSWTACEHGSRMTITGCLFRWVGNRRVQLDRKRRCNEAPFNPPLVGDHVTGLHLDIDDLALARASQLVELVDLARDPQTRGRVDLAFRHRRLVREQDSVALDLGTRALFDAENRRRQMVARQMKLSLRFHVLSSVHRCVSGGLV